MDILFLCDQCTSNFHAINNKWSPFWSKLLSSDETTTFFAFRSLALHTLCAFGYTVVLTALLLSRQLHFRIFILFSFKTCTSYHGCFKAEVLNFYIPCRPLFGQPYLLAGPKLAGPNLAKAKIAIWPIRAEIWPRFTNLKKCKATAIGRLN